jgi:hypothetical protein
VRDAEAFLKAIAHIGNPLCRRQQFAPPVVELVRRISLRLGQWMPERPTTLATRGPATASASLAGRVQVMGRSVHPRFADALKASVHW